MDEYDEEALRADANESWQPWSLQLEGWKTKLNDLQFTPADFSVAPGSPALFEAFTTARAVLHEYIHSGEEIFEGIARILLETAAEYMEMEGYAQAEIDQVESEIEQL